MLFRRHQTIITFISVGILSLLCGLSADQRDGQNEGMKFGKSMLANSVKFDNVVSVDELTPQDQRGKTFDAEEARKRVKEQNIPKNETYELLQSPNIFRYQEFQPDEEVFKHADSLVEQYSHGVIEQSYLEEGYKIETCLQHDAPFDIEVKHSLNVKIRNISETKQSCRTCKGHRRKIDTLFIEFKKSVMEEEVKRLAADPTIKSYGVKDVKGKPLILSRWTHYDDATTCQNYKVEESALREDCSEAEDIWTVDNPENEKIAHTPNCTFIKSERLGSGAKMIGGVEVYRDSWARIDTYKCRYDPEKCPFFNTYKCIQEVKKCKQFSGDQCALWEITFKCHTGSDKFRVETGETFGMGEELWETGYELNTSFSEAVTKLQVFEEMKKEFENSKHPDIRFVQLFGGKKSQCSKSVADDLMYDCCFSFHGLANELKLSKCSADEIALAEMREKGLCYYIGSYEEKFLELWKSRIEHVYCCFPTKLARVLQQEGRKQLGIDWGTPKQPNCRGLTQDEIHRLDLSKLDLSEAYDTPPSIDMNDKIQRIQEHLKRRLAEGV